MKVWIFNHDAMPPSLGALVRHYYFAKHLKNQGHEVKIFTSSKIHNADINMITGKEIFLEKEIDGVEYTFVRCSDYTKNGFDRIQNMLQFSMRIWKTRKKYNAPDVIYTSSPDIFTAISATLLAKKMKVKKVVEIRDLWPESIVEYSGKSKNNPVIRILYSFEKWLYKVADKLIFTIEGGPQYIRDKGWDSCIEMNKIHHVNNGVDLQEFERNKTDYTLSDEDLDNADTFKIIYAGSVRQANNVGQLVKAMEQVKGKRECQLLIYGDGSERDQLEDYCRQKNIQNVKFKGRVDKKYIPYILSKSNLNIINYKQTNLWKYGGSQNKLFEYLASGVPVCSNVEMGYSIIMNNGCGVERCMQDELDYAETIQKFVDMDDEAYEQYKKNALRTVQEYDYTKLAEKIEKILLEAISK